MLQQPLPNVLGKAVLFSQGAMLDSTQPGNSALDPAADFLEVITEVMKTLLLTSVEINPCGGL